MDVQRLGCRPYVALRATRCCHAGGWSPLHSQGHLRFVPSCTAAAMSEVFEAVVTTFLGSWRWAPPPICCVPRAHGQGGARERSERPTANLLAERLPNVRLNGHPTRRLPIPSISSSRVPTGMPSRRLCDVAVSSGSACTSAVPTPSHVLVAMGLTPDVANTSLRFSLGWTTTASEVDVASGRIVTAVLEVRQAIDTGPNSMRSRAS